MLYHKNIVLSGVNVLRPTTDILSLCALFHATVKVDFNIAAAAILSFVGY